MLAIVKFGFLRALRQMRARVLAHRGECVTEWRARSDTKLATAALESSGRLAAFTTCQVSKSENCRMMLFVRLPVRQPARVPRAPAEKAEQHNAARRNVLSGWSAKALSDASIECEVRDMASLHRE